MQLGKLQLASLEVVVAADCWGLLEVTKEGLLPAAPFHAGLKPICTHHTIDTPTSDCESTMSADTPAVTSVLNLEGSK